MTATMTTSMMTMAITNSTAADVTSAATTTV